MLARSCFCQRNLAPLVIPKLAPLSVDGRSCLNSPISDDGGGRSWITVGGYPRTGGRALCVHGAGSVHGLFGLSDAQDVAYAAWTADEVGAWSVGPPDAR